MIALTVASLMIVGMERNAFANSGSKMINHSVDTLDTAVLTPPPCVNNTSTSGPWTDYFNMVNGIYHCQTYNVTILHESPNSVTLRFLDGEGSESVVIEEAGILNWHTLSHQDDSVLTTDVLVPNP